MQDIIFQFYDFFKTLISVYIIYQLFGLKVNFKRVILITLSILAIYWPIIFSINVTHIINDNIYIFVVVIIIFIYSGVNFFQVFICTVITHSIHLMLKDMLINVIVSSNNISTSNLYNDIPALILEEATFLMLYLSILVLIKHYKLSLFNGEEIFYFKILNSKTKYRNIIFNRYNIIIVVIVAQMWLLAMYFQLNDSTMFYISPEVHSIQQNLHILIISFVIIILSITVIFIVKNILITEKEQYLYKTKEQEFAQIKQQDKINRQFKHDLSNHMKLISILAKREKYDELNNYLANYDEEVKSNIITVNTGLEELDILLNSKITFAQMQNIIVKYRCIADIKCDNRHIINLVSILGNVLDNAIEASEKSYKRIINIDINENSMDYIFIIKNTTDCNELVASDLLLSEGYSTKGQDRGIGLSVVKKLVKRFNGNINMSVKNNRFVMRINIPRHELERG